MSYDVIIVGAGPAGLACAKQTAARGLSTLVFERRQLIGKKVCGGGITWNGLIKRIPKSLHERSFPQQHIFTRFQKTTVLSPTPIIATVNRIKLGEYMAKEAVSVGAEIMNGCRVVKIDGSKSLYYFDKKNRKTKKVTFKYLVGADGSSSMVRRFLKIPVTSAGIGINYQLEGNFKDMQWHLLPHLFGSGYGWVFPHKNSISVGAYVSRGVLKASTLDKNLHRLATKIGISLDNQKASAELINYDFRGYRFDNIFLAGDASGLASGLTGEGIYSAIVSGETIGRILSNLNFVSEEFNRIIKNNALHKKLVSFAGKNNIVATLLSESVSAALRMKIIPFSAVEMSR